MTRYQIQEEHMKNRCYFVSTLFGLSVYGWYNYSLFDPIIVDVYTSYYQSCLLMLFYLGWDTYHMTLGPNRSILYRSDLMIHHSISSVVFMVTLPIIPIFTNHLLIMECISIFNYALRNNQNVLNVYRILCIVIVRIPLILYSYCVFVPGVLEPHLKSLTVYYPQYILFTYTMLLTFIVYDINILWRIYKK